MDDKLHNKISLFKWIKRIMIFLYPIRDMLGLILMGVPLRLGEIWSGVVGIIGFASGKIRIKRSEIGIVLILLMNLFLSVVVLAFNISNVDTSFAIKYIIRNILNLIFIVGALVANTQFTDKDFIRLCKNIVILQAILLVVTESTGLHVYMNELRGWSSLLSTGQFVDIAGLRIVRFMGSASEAGYLGPLLIMPYYFFLDRCITNKGKGVKKGKKFLIGALLCAMFTLSTAVYILFIVFTAYYFISRSTNKRALKKLFFVILGAAIICSIGLLLPQIREFIQLHIINKIQFYLAIGSNVQFDWSAMDRSQHLRNAWAMFTGGNILEILVGHGTGAYLAASLANTSLLVSNVEEAYNIYLSTLTDRGVLGLLLIIFLFLYVKKIVIKGNIVSESIFAGIVAQYIHWVLTGNMWLYYFWYEIIFLVWYRRFFYCKGQLGYESKNI